MPNLGNDDLSWKQMPGKHAFACHLLRFSRPSENLCPEQVLACVEACSWVSNVDTRSRQALALLVIDKSFSIVTSHNSKYSVIYNSACFLLRSFAHIPRWVAPIHPGIFIVEQTMDEIAPEYDVVVLGTGKWF